MAKEGERKLVPKLRFPEFRKEEIWDATPLEEIAERITTRNDDGTVTRVLTNSAEHGVLDQRDYFDREIATAGKVDGYYIVEQGDYVYNPRKSLIAPVGPISRNNVGKGIMSPLYTVFRFSTDATDFYEHYFRSTGWHSYLRNASSTGARHDRMSITAGAFMRMPVPMPSPAEQQKIADCLTSLDEVVAAQGRKVEALKAHKRSLMQQLFPQEGETLPRLRFPEFEGSKPWEHASIENLVKTEVLHPPRDGNHGNLHPKSADYVETGIPFIMASDIKGGKIDYFGCTHIPKSLADSLQKGFAAEGDVLLTHKGTVGEVAVIGEINFPYVMLTPQVTYYRVKDSCRLSNLFLAAAFVSDVFQHDLMIAAGGATRSYIGITEQAKLSIPIPSLIAEQRLIADCLSSLDARIAAEGEKLAALKTHKQGLMQQLFPAP